jgi:hypothetical protein
LGGAQTKKEKMGENKMKKTRNKLLENKLVCLMLSAIMTGVCFSAVVLDNYQITKINKTTEKGYFWHIIAALVDLLHPTPIGGKPCPGCGRYQDEICICYLTVDTDGDGIADYLEDRDHDGIHDHDDCDGDGIPDSEQDHDGDGIPDSIDPTPYPPVVDPCTPYYDEDGVWHNPCEGQDG